MAGTGKSTIARTIAHHFDKQQLLGASFLFSRGRGDLGHAERFFSTIAVQIVKAIPAVKPDLCDAVTKPPKIAKQGLREQWNRLVFHPLSNLRGVSIQPQTIVLVIDALDECHSEDDIRLIIQLLAEANAIKTLRLRVLITSRPDIPIRFVFNTISKATHEDFILHEISESVVTNDLSIFFHHELEIIRRKFQLPEGWPGKHIAKLLCQRAGGLFIYASTACLFIADPLWDPIESLSLILKDAYIGQSPTGRLDEMYLQILVHAFTLQDRNKRDEVKLSDEFRESVGYIVVLFDSLPVNTLAKLFIMPEGTIHARLRSLHSVLEVPKDQGSPVRLFHLSFRDFLLNRERCTNPQFWVDEEKAHENLLLRCLKLMSEHLRKDICNLRLPGTLASEIKKSKVKQYLPLELQYACCYWVQHLQKSRLQLDDYGHVYKFLQEHLLHWLEALGWIGKTTEGIQAILSLEAYVSVSDLFIIY
jgi:hypothetical protein